MSLQKLLATPRGALYKNVFSVKRRSGDMATLNHVVPSPPRVRIPLTEKILFGVLLNIGMWFTPIWVICHMPEYQKVDRNTYIGQ